MKQFTIKETRYSFNGMREKEITGTLEELIQYFSYTLECGKSWERERGNKKINVHPKTIKSLVNNLNNAKTNSAANGCPNEYYDVVETVA